MLILASTYPDVVKAVFEAVSGNHCTEKESSNDISHMSPYTESGQSERMQIIMNASYGLAGCI